MVALVQCEGQGFTSYVWPRAGSDRPLPKESYVAGFPAWGWLVGTGAYVDDLHAQALAGAAKLAAVAVLIALGVGALTIVIGRGITQPLLAMAGAVSRLADGEKICDPGDRSPGRARRARPRARQHLRPGVDAARIRIALDNCPARC